MANQEHLDVLKQGVDVWNTWRAAHPDVERPDLTGAKLREANLTGANLTGANLNWAHLEEADLTAADLTAANLTGASLVNTKLARSILTDCSIFGISAWKVDLTDATQINLIITDRDEPTVTVDDLEVAQFIYLLLNHKKLRNVLNSVTERGVLILGRFGNGGLSILQSIAVKLRDLNYLPIIFDFDRPDDRNYTETIKTLAGLSRFVIADLSGPSVPQELYATVPHFKIPFVPIMEESRKVYGMFADFAEYSWVLPLVRYTSTEHLLELLPTKIIRPAEEKQQARQALLKQIFDS